LGVFGDRVGFGTGFGFRDFLGLSGEGGLSLGFGVGGFICDSFEG